MKEIIGSAAALIVFFILIIVLLIYLTIKILQFIVIAVNLYKQMIQNQKRMIELLKLNLPQHETKGEQANKKCPSCGRENSYQNKFCEFCGHIL